MGMNCTYPETAECRFRPNMTATTGPTTSLMFMHFLPTVKKDLFVCTGVIFQFFNELFVK